MCDMTNRLLFITALLGVGALACAQTPTHEHYVIYPEGGANDNFASKYRSWQIGQPFDSNFADDEEFFISRVKLKDRFTYAQTQVDPEQDPARRFLWWVPMGQSQWNAVPAYFYNSEVFNMWSYIDHWGNWTAPFLRAPGAYLDVCHKNGVTTSVVAAVAYGASVNESSPEPHGPNIAALIDGGYEKLLEYLRYYGVDGIGFNSEFSMNPTMATNLQNLAANAHLHGGDYGVPFSYCWYGVTGDGGGMGNTWDSLNTGNDDWFWNTSLNAPVANYFFPNYNWRDSHLQTSESVANGFSEGASWNVYMGMDMQGRDYANWTMLQNYDVSFGMWGAHNMNMLYESRGEAGSSGTTPQETYLKRSELFFTGGTQNPVNPPAISDHTYYSIGNAQAFHGISSFITARSVLQGDLGTEPFVTYFNLGNGMFFNVEGETTFDKEWYNVGIQDYLPTWRWWWTTDFMGRDESDVPESGLTATFTWDDAWFGGSCMRISGTTDGEYLQLFKTKYPVVAGDRLTIRYKVLGGDASIDWAVATEEDMTEENVTEVSGGIRNAGDATSAGEWQEATIEIGTGMGNLRVADETLALIGLHFTEATDLDLLIGEISLTRTDAPTPAAPELRKDITGYEDGAKVLARNYQGVDVKVVWSMGEAPADRPWETLYNEDVNAWYYKVYVQQQGAEPVMCTATTSWAAYVVGAPLTDGESPVRVGVSAVSLDGKTESDIAWSDYMELPEATIVEGIEVDKAVIKPGEEFTVRYIDPNHSAADSWAIRRSTASDSDAPLISADGTTSVTGTLDEIGLYDVEVTVDGVSETHRGLVQISGEEVGAVPQIESVAVNGGTTDVAAVEGEAVTYSYVGRNADGTVSRGLALPSNGFGMDFEQFGFNESSPFTIALWFRPDELIMGTAGVTGLSIRNPKQDWPENNWGFMWQDIMQDSTIRVAIKDRSGSGQMTFMNKEFRFEAKRWYHICIVFDYDSNQGRIATVYVNGKSLGTQNASSLYPYGNGAGFYLIFGGYAANRTAFTGAIDEFQVYDMALNQEQALKTMEHQDEIPEGLVAYWDFETNPDAENYLHSTGENTDLKAYVMLSASGDGGEGDTDFSISPATFDAGAPFLPGIYEVVTTPEWGVDIRNASLSGESVSPTGGSVEVSYSVASDYSATLTLRNSWGEDTMEFPMVVVSVGLDDVEGGADNTVYPNPFEEELYIAFAEAGAYTVNVYSLAGNLVSSQAVSAVGGDVINVRVNAAPGTYVVKVSDAAGDVVTTAKVIKR